MKLAATHQFWKDEQWHKEEKIVDGADIVRWLAKALAPKDTTRHSFRIIEVQEINSVASPPVPPIKEEGATSTKAS